MAKLKNKVVKMFENLNINKYQNFLPKVTEIDGGTEVMNENILVDKKMLQEFKEKPGSFPYYFLWNREVYTEKTGIITTNVYELLKNAIENDLYFNRGKLFWNLYNSIVLNGPGGMEDLINNLETIAEHTGLEKNGPSEENIIGVGSFFDKMLIEKYVTTILNRLKMEETIQNVDLKNIGAAIEKYEKLANKLRIIDSSIKIKQEKLEGHSSLIKQVSGLLTKIFSSKKELNKEEIEKITQTLKSKLKELKFKREKILQNLEKYKIIIDKGLNSNNP